MNAWSVNHRAARAVALYARDADEAREFLAMIGLTADGRITPDDTRTYDVESAGPDKPVAPTALRVVLS